MQFLPIVSYLSEEGIAHIITPDLRGHGFSPERRGDIDYIGQLEDDLADLISELKNDYPNAHIVLPLIFPATSSKISISLSVPSPFTILVSIRYNQPVPSRHGVH